MLAPESTLIRCRAVIVVTDAAPALSNSSVSRAALREFIADYTPAVSIISRIEVLGYHKLMEGDRRSLERFFELAETLPLTEAVVNSAVNLRNSRAPA